MKTYKIIIYSVLTLICWWAIVYGATAFATWEHNPGLWSVSVRGSATLVGVFFGFMFGALVAVGLLGDGDVEEGASR